MAAAPAPLRASDVIQALFLRPFIRRMKYLYTGFGVRDGLFPLNTMGEDDFTYCDADQGVGLVQVHDAERLAVVQAWFDSLHVDLRAPGVVSLLDISAALNRVKWDIGKVPLTKHDDGRVTFLTEAEVERTVFEPITNEFLLDHVYSTARLYLRRALDKEEPVCDVPAMADDKSNLLALEIARDTLAASPVGDAHGAAVRFVAVKGLDLLNTKPLLEKGAHEATFIGVRLWRTTGTSLAYAHVFEGPAVTITAARPHLFLTPGTGGRLRTERRCRL